MPDPRRQLSRADLPDELTPETIRELPLGVLRRLSRPGNGVLSPEEQATYDAALHQVMRESAKRVSGQIDRADWAEVMRDAHRDGPRGGPGRQSRADQQLRRLARRFGEQVDVAEGLAPGVDWSFAQTQELTPPPEEPAPEDDDPTTVSDLEAQLSDQVELVQVMSEIAEVSKRTYALEQQRDLQSTRSVFFGFVVSVAVLVAGWAPLVAASDWEERVWILVLTVATVVAAGLVYGLVRRYQTRHQDDGTSDQSG